MGCTIQAGQTLLEASRASRAEAIAASSYFPKHRFPDLLEFVPDMQSILKLLMEQYNCDHLRQVTTVSARTVKPQDARLLGLPLNHPILLVESVNVDR